MRTQRKAVRQLSKAVPSEHVALVTNDMEKTVRFYCDVLGMRLIGTLGNQPGGLPYRHYFFSLGPGNAFAFFEWPEVELPPRKDSGVPASGRQFDHVAFAVASEEDLLTAQRGLRDANWNCSEVVDHEPVYEDPKPVPAAAERGA